MNNLAVIADNFYDAVDEALAYEQMGSLDDDILVDISNSYGVSVEKLKKALEEH